jgi:hypothetical protein
MYDDYTTINIVCQAARGMRDKLSGHTVSALEAIAPVALLSGIRDYANHCEPVRPLANFVTDDDPLAGGLSEGAGAGVRVTNTSLRGRFEAWRDCQLPRSPFELSRLRGGRYASVKMRQSA